MRQIKFRGKSNTGEWVYGSLVYSENIHPAIYFETGKGNIKSLEWVYVDPETVGQFTGLTDKNGKEIYEGDILKYDTGKHYVVVYSTEGLDSNTNDFYIGAFMLKDDHGFHELICSVTRPYKYAEIIGNIHDNPDLLTK